MPIVCPFGGAFIGVFLGIYIKIVSIQFVCTSAQGEKVFGPYGEGSKEMHIEKLICPDGQYISSFYGMSGSDEVSRIGIRCRPENDIKGKGGGDVFGWERGTKFDDIALSVDRRPVSITIRAQNHLYAIQVTYGNTKIVGKLCTKGCSK